jgi:hypothetical protein
MRHQLVDAVSRFFQQSVTMTGAAAAQAARWWARVTLWARPPPLMWLASRETYKALQTFL